MARITFILLAHDNPSGVAALSRALTQWDNGAHVVIHFDKKAQKADFTELERALAGEARIHILARRARAAWGGFGLVEAPMRALKLIRDENIGCDRVMLLSASCLPMRSLEAFSAFLDQNADLEFIESHDADWIVGGLRHERYQYWHLFNFQTQYPLFRRHYHLQRRLSPKRAFPQGLTPRWGSQWWCLTWPLCDKILDFVAARPSAYRFFRTTWIPDESFFQTMAYHLAGPEKISGRTLTFFHFNAWGRPFVFLDDHIDLLRTAPFFFVRKIGARAKKLRAHLLEVAQSPATVGEQQLDPRKRYVFPIEDALADKTTCALNTPSLAEQRQTSGWAGALRRWPRPILAIQCADAAWDRIAEALSATNTVSVLGRIFHPEGVEFSADVIGFHGLRHDDHAIRDADRPLYFARILDRADRALAFRLAPQDRTADLDGLLDHDKVMVLNVDARGENSDQLAGLHLLQNTPEALSAAIAALSAEFKLSVAKPQTASAHIGDDRT